MQSFTGRNEETGMKKLLQMVIYNLSVTVIVLLSLYIYMRHMIVLSYILTAGLFGALIVRAYLEEKVIKKDPSIVKEGIYKVTNWLKFFSLLILAIGVWYIRSTNKV